MSYRYRPDVLRQLAAHGIAPVAETPPQLVHDFVNDLYRYELRRLRDRLLQREFPKPAYSARVLEVRNRYRLLAFKPAQWIVSATHAGD